MNICARLGGFNVIDDDNMVERVRKTFLEHFTWKFWEMYKIIPRKDFIILDKEMVIICHPVMTYYMKKEIERLI